jgi:predicted PhzF superfamily epimerase YddE/YHI9
VPIFQVDAFTTRRYAGNPAAVLLLESYPEDATLQAIAAENNLAETAFLVPDGDDYRLRWFTPTVEVPLCGHATLASAAVVMERLHPGRATVTFQTASGPLPVWRTPNGYTMDLPARRSVPATPPPLLLEALRVPVLETLVHPLNYLVVLADAGTVRRLAPDIAAIARLDRGGVIVTAAGDGGYDMVSRYFAPAKGIPEDPVTGGAHCALAPYWSDRLGKSMLRGWQASSRGGEIICRMKDQRVELSGPCVFYMEGVAEI